MSSLTQILLGPVCYGAPIGKDFDSTEIKKILPHVPPPSTPIAIQIYHWNTFKGTKISYLPPTISHATHS